ncbi:hypothetical protein HYW11_01650 [Candidatus Peregrinibacteria bacterium]|nr:hypothetical protein [Candidatus Peregrinibacteria bacterium]
MPLKHTTETRLVLFLGVTLVCIGFTVRLLPPLPDGAVLWGVAWLLSFLYPLLLLPLFRERRADYAFRMLHFLPSVLLLLWVALAALRLSGFSLGVFFAWYTWEYGVLPIIVSFLLLFLYCFHVIRQRVRRSIALSFLLLFFVFSSVHSQFGSWRDLLASSTEVPSEDLSSSVNTDPSFSLGEEVWRMRLRRMHRRQGRLGREGGLVDRPALPLEKVPVLVNASSSSTPPLLVSSGFDVRWILLLFLALYMGMLHERARRRVCSW